MSRRVFVVEDHPTMRRSLCDLIDAQPGLEVAGSAASGEAALDDLDGVEVDLVLIDMALPGMSGTELVQALLQRSPDLRCAILSGYDDDPYVEQALAAGARGYILKGLPYEIVPGVQKVLNGELYLSEPVR